MVKTQQQRKVWRTSKAGAIARLKLIEEILPELSSDDVEITVKAVGLNFADIFAITGLYSATPTGSFIPGLEYSGIVSKVGENCTRFSVGDRIMAVSRFGGYASIIQSREDYLVPLPDDWSFSQGAAYLTQTLTAWYALNDLGGIKPGHDVLVQSGAGGVGLQAMKLIKALGGNPIGTVSSEHKVKFLANLGFEAWVREPSFGQQLKQKNKTFDLVLDAIGGEVQTASFNALKPMGRLVVFGAAEFTPGKNRPNYLTAVWKYLRRPKYDVMGMISENRSVMAFNLIWLWDQIELMKVLLENMMAVEITPPHVGHEFSFDQAHQAIDLLRSGKTIGKVVLLIE
ncbi:MAG: zinc-binding dehydrogenase [Oleispira sp.]|nr:zinc-binding dehydrogenase [Oleispira sp.]MBL4881178.1 zinc-binding dehydrogenase [Oleispira sp.]